MNKVKGWFIVAAGIALAGVAQAQLTNPGFETGDLTGWSAFGQGWRTSAGGDAYSGSYGLINDVQPSDGDTYRGVFQNVPVVGGHNYEAGAQMRGVSIGTSESWFELQFLDSSGNVIVQYQSPHMTADQAFAFMGVGMVTAPVSAVTASVRGVVYMPSAPADTDFHNFDEFYFQDVTPPDSGLSNAGFESDFTSWNTFGQGWRIGGGGDAHSGSKGAVNDVLPSDGDGFRGVFQNVPVQAGWPYRASVYIHGVNLQTSESWIEVQWFNSSGGQVGQDNSTHMSSDQPFTLTELNNLVAPAGAVTASVRAVVQMLSPPGDADFHVFDDFDFGLRQATVTGSLALSSIPFNGSTTVTGTGGSGDGDYEFRQNGGSGSVSFGVSGNPRTITGVAVGSAAIEVRRLGNSRFAASVWTSAGTLTVAKATPTVSPWPTASAISEGQPLSASTLSGGSPSVPGTFAFVNPSLRPPQGSASQSVRFTPDDSANYNVITGSVSVTVQAPLASGLTNPGFESDFTSWNTFGQGWRIGAGGDAYTGVKGAVNDVLATDVDSYRGVFQFVPVSAGATYNAGAFIHAVAVESSESWLEIQWFNAAGNVIGQQQSARVANDQPFTLASLDGVEAPAGAVTASVRGVVFMSSPPVNDADFQIFDDFSFGLQPANATGSLGAASIVFTNFTTVTATGGSGTGAYEFRQQGGSGAISFGGSGNSQTVTPVTVGTAVIQVRRLGDSSYAASSWTTVGTLTVSKAAPIVTTWPTASTIYQGQSLSASTLSGGSASVSGSFGFVNPSFSPPEGTANQAVRFTPTDATNYLTVDGVVSVTVNPAPEHLLVNPGFESGLSGWSTFGQGWRASGGADARSGSLGAVDDVLVTDVDSYRGLYQVVSAVAGLTYNAGVYVKAVSVGASESWLEIQWLDASSNVISQVASAHVTSDQAFTLVSLPGIVAPAGAVAAGFRLIVYMPSPPGDPDFHVFDDAYFILANKPAEITNFAANALTFVAKPGVVYRVFYTDNPDPAAGTWTAQGTGESGSGSATVAVTEGARRYFQVLPDGGVPSADERVMWGVIKPTVQPGYTMMAPPLVGDRALNGGFGAALATGLTGNDNGTADRMYVRDGGVWREFYVHSSQAWYENGSPASFTLGEGQGFYLYRSQSPAVTLRFSGALGNIAAQPSTADIVTGWNILGPSLGKTRTFAQLVAGIQSPAAGWSDDEADLIVIDEGGGNWRRIMRFAGGGWYDLKAGSPSPSATIQPGTGIYYYRLPASGATTMDF